MAIPPFTVFGYGSLIFKVSMSAPIICVQYHQVEWRLGLINSLPHMLYFKVYPVVYETSIWLVFSFPLVSGFLKGYVRRFAQKSHDHRGTPEVSSNRHQSCRFDGF